MPIKKRLVLEELVGFGLSIISYRLCLKFFSGFIFATADGVRWIPLLGAITPQVFLYLGFRFSFPALSAGIISASIAIILSLAHQKKLALIDSPLTWADISQLNNFPVVQKYLSLSHGILLVGLLILIMGSLAWFKPTKEKFKFLLRMRAFTFSLLGLLLFWPNYLSSNSNSFEKLLKNSFKFGVGYISWDWQGNIKSNGLLSHLIHTSSSVLPMSANDKERLKFSRLRETERKETKRAKTVVLVLCEGCWHDKNHFKDLFLPLKQSGFSELRSISPVFGGGTVNASFELLFGLPSRSEHVSGTIYQEYSQRIKDRAEALPRFFKRNGYRTVAIHNFYKTMWNRHTINPKLGFDRFIALEDMSYAPNKEDLFPDDSILYHAAIRELDGNRGNPLFLYLVTLYGHGPFFEKNGDLGVGEYRRKIGLSIKQLADFSEKLFQIDKEALILVVADHKPGLNQWFFESGVLPREMFDTKNWWVSAANFEKQRGDVPVYIKSHKSSLDNQFVKEASGAPFYCLVAQFNNKYMNLPWPAVRYATENKICEHQRMKSYKKTNASYPSWLYSLSLFEEVPEGSTPPLRSSLDQM